MRALLCGVPGDLQVRAALCGPQAHGLRRSSPVVWPPGQACRGALQAMLAPHTGPLV